MNKKLIFRVNGGSEDHVEIVFNELSQIDEVIEALCRARGEFAESIKQEHDALTEFSIVDGDEDENGKDEDEGGDDNIEDKYTHIWGDIVMMKERFEEFNDYVGEYLAKVLNTRKK